MKLRGLYLSSSKSLGLGNVTDDLETYLMKQIRDFITCSNATKHLFVLILLRTFVSICFEVDFLVFLLKKYSFSDSVIYLLLNQLSFLTLEITQFVSHYVQKTTVNVVTYIFVLFVTISVQLIWKQQVRERLV